GVETIVVKNNTLDINQWITRQRYAEYAESWRDHPVFFGQCPQAQNKCIEDRWEDHKAGVAEWGSRNLTDEHKLWHEGRMQCRIDIDQFVVIYWPLERAISRDL